MIPDKINITIQLPYHTQGTDLLYNLDQSETVEDAFLSNANQLKSAINDIELLVKYIKLFDVVKEDITIDDHYITMRVVPALAYTLVRLELAEFEEM